MVNQSPSCSVCRWSINLLSRNIGGTPNGDTVSGYLLRTDIQHAIDIDLEVTSGLVYDKPVRTGLCLLHRWSWKSVWRLIVRWLHNEITVYQNCCHRQAIWVKPPLSKWYSVCITCYFVIIFVWKSISLHIIRKVRVRMYGWTYSLLQLRAKLFVVSQTSKCWKSKKLHH